MKIAKTFPGLSFLPHPPNTPAESIYINVPGDMSPTEILETAQADFSREQRCRIHEFSYIGEPVTYYTCDSCKYRKTLAWDWVISGVPEPDCYERFSDALDDLEEAIGLW